MSPTHVWMEKGPGCAYSQDPQAVTTGLAGGSGGLSKTRRLEKTSSGRKGVCVYLREGAQSVTIFASRANASPRTQGVVKSRMERRQPLIQLSWPLSSASPACTECPRCQGWRLWAGAQHLGLPLSVVGIATATAEHLPFQPRVHTEPWICYHSTQMLAQLSTSGAFFPGGSTESPV